MESFNILVSKLWNFEFKKVTNAHLKLVLVSVILVGLVYVVGEVLFGLNPLAGGFSVLDFFHAGDSRIASSEGWKVHFPEIWLSIAVLVVIVRVSVIILSYLKAKQVLGEVAFARYIITYFSSFAFASILSLSILWILMMVAGLFGIHPSSGFNVLTNFVFWLEALANAYLPTVFNVHSYWLAIVLSIFLLALPGYFVHWLSHKLRFFWYVFHRAHHCPEFLHPLGAPPAFAFEFVLVIPSGLMAIAISKLIYTEPLVMEMGLWFTFGYAFEIFNHSIVHYDFAYRNIFVRNMSRLFGDRGVYHLVHHSAKPNDQTINLGASPFLFWDRLFGTYRKPYIIAPTLGLTNTPKIHHNPLRIILSGISQLIFELRENKNWFTRLKVLFGPIHYMPPKTKEYLILGY